MVAHAAQDMGAVPGDVVEPRRNQTVSDGVPVGASGGPQQRGNHDVVGRAPCCRHEATLTGRA